MSKVKGGSISFFKFPIGWAKAFYADVACKLKAAASDAPFAAYTVLVMAVMMAGIVAIFGGAMAFWALIGGGAGDPLWGELPLIFEVVVMIVVFFAIVGLFKVFDYIFDIRGRFMGKFVAVIRTAIDVIKQFGVLLIVFLAMVLVFSEMIEYVVALPSLVFISCVSGAVIAGIVVMGLYAAGKRKIELSVTTKVSDWQKDIESNFALNMSMPDGWTYKEGIIKNGTQPIFESRFTTNAKDKKAAYNSLKEYLFGLTKKTSDGGNFIVANVFAIDTVPPNGEWCFITSKGTIKIEAINKRKYVLLAMTLLGDTAVSVG
jgi:hypothetical protein